MFYLHSYQLSNAQANIVGLLKMCPPANEFNSKTVFNYENFILDVNVSACEV